MVEATSNAVVDVIICGGGLCGVLAGHRCAVEGFTYKIIEKETDFGGVWHTLANEHSHLQAFEAMYRWNRDYPLGDNPLAKLSAPAVLHKMREFARDFGLYKSAYFNSVVVSTNYNESLDLYDVHFKEMQKNSIEIARGKFIFITTGILGTQLTPEERGYKDIQHFQGVFALAGRNKGKDSIIGKLDCDNKVVAIIGSGAFACEAMEAAIHRGAEHVHVISRERTRWVLPFSRQFTTTFVSYAPLLPWQLKMTLLKAYLHHVYYRPCGITHMMPDLNDMDYTGQCNDAFFRLAKSGRVSFSVDRVKNFTEDGLHLVSGNTLHADVVVLAAGCKYISRPHILHGVNTGYDDLYNYTFMGPSARIGTASDFVFGFVPDGPNKQLDLFIHGMKCHSNGSFQAFKETLKPTKLNINAGPGVHEGSQKSTWFSTRTWYSTLNSGIQERNELYMASMAVGLSWIEKQYLWLSIAGQQLKFWAISGVLSIIEIFTLPVF